jgi:hypothetical protein
MLASRLVYVLLCNFSLTADTDGLDCRVCELSVGGSEERHGQGESFLLTPRTSLSVLTCRFSVCWILRREGLAVSC